MDATLRYRRSAKGQATIKAYNSRYYAANRQILITRRVDYNRERRYGVSITQYNEELAKQNGVCKICKGTNSSGRRLGIDHDHKTNQFRGLLCDRCNRGIGFFRENPELMTQAMEYLCRTQK